MISANPDDDFVDTSLENRIKQLEKQLEEIKNNHYLFDRRIFALEEKKRNTNSGPMVFK